MNDLLAALRADERINLVAKHIIDLGYAKEDREFAREKDRSDTEGSDRYYDLLVNSDENLEQAREAMIGLKANAYELMFAMAIVNDEKRLRKLLEARLDALYQGFQDGLDDDHLWSELARLGWTEAEVARLDSRKVPFRRLRDILDGCYGKWRGAARSAAELLYRLDTFDEPIKICVTYYDADWRSHGIGIFETREKDFNAVQAEIDRRIVEGDLTYFAPIDWPGNIMIDASRHAGCTPHNEHKTFEEIRTRHFTRIAA